MQTREVAKLLTYIAVGDNRQVDEATVRMWQDVVGNLDFTDSYEAVRQHRMTSTEYLMPVHVREGVQKIRNQRIKAAEAHMPEFPGDPDDIAGWLKWNKAMIATIADGATPEQAKQSDLVRRVLPDLKRMLPSLPPVTRDERAIDDRVVPYRSAPKPPAEVTGAQREALEAERARQLRALEITMRAVEDES